MLGFKTCKRLICLSNPVEDFNNKILRMHSVVLVILLPLVIYPEEMFHYPLNTVTRFFGFFMLCKKRRIRVLVLETRILKTIWSTNCVLSQKTIITYIKTIYMIRFRSLIVWNMVPFKLPYLGTISIMPFDQLNFRHCIQITYNLYQNYFILFHVI